VAGALGNAMAILEGILRDAPPPELRVLLEWLFAGRGLYLYVRFQQTTGSITARMCAAVVFPASLTQTNLGHAAFYRIRGPVWRDAPSHRRSEPDVTDLFN
jgi:hypothetical protein